MRSLETNRFKNELVSAQAKTYNIILSEELEYYRSTMAQQSRFKDFCTRCEVRFLEDVIFVDYRMQGYQRFQSIAGRAVVFVIVYYERAYPSKILYMQNRLSIRVLRGKLRRKIVVKLFINITYVAASLSSFVMRLYNDISNVKKLRIRYLLTYIWLWQNVRHMRTYGLSQQIV